MSDNDLGLFESDETPATSGKKVRLRVRSAHVHSFSLPREGADTLVVTKKGSEFSREDADALKEAAEASGVTLTEVSE